jgi:HEAT repeat protein
MKNWLKITIIFCLAFAPFFVQANSPKSKKKVQNKLSNMSVEALEKMRLDQNLINLSNDNYQVFETTVYYFETTKGKYLNALLDHLKSNKEDNKIVIAVIYTLGRMGGSSARAVPVLIPYINNPDRDIALTAISALGRIGSASDKAVGQLQQLVFDENDKLLSTASLRALKEINTPNALAIVKEYENIKMLEKKRKQVNQEAK